MVSVGRAGLGRYGRFVGLAVALTAAVAALGYAPTLRLAGPRGVEAMFAGCVAGAAASMIGGLPIALAGAGTAPDQAAVLGLASMVLRFLVALGLGAAGLAADWWPRRPFLLWLGISYVALLIADTVFALGAVRETTGGEGPETARMETAGRPEAEAPAEDRRSETDRP